MLLVNRSFALLWLRRTPWMWVLQMLRLQMLQVLQLRALLLIFQQDDCNSDGGSENGRPVFSMCEIPTTSPAAQINENQFFFHLLNNLLFSSVP